MLDLNHQTSTLLASGSSSNIDLTLSSKGAGNMIYKLGTTTMYTLTLNGSSDSVFSNYTATGTNAGFIFATKGTGQIKFGVNGGTSNSVSSDLVINPNGASTVNYVQIKGANTNNGPTITFTGSDANTHGNIALKGSGNFYILGNADTTPSTQFHFATVNNAVNYTTSFAGAAGGGIGFQVYGGSADANVDFLLASKGSTGAIKLVGSGSIIFYTGNNGNRQAEVTHVASAVNYMQFKGAATTGTPTITATGSDTNVGLDVVTKGTGQFTVNGSPVGGATGASGDAVFYENDQTVTASYTLTAGKNAMSAGPINIANGVTVTIPTGATWSII